MMSWMPTIVVAAYVLIGVGTAVHLAKADPAATGCSPPATVACQPVASAGLGALWPVYWSINGLWSVVP